LVDGGIDYFKGDADVNVSVVAQNFLMVKMAGRSFGRKKNYSLTVTVSSEPLEGVLYRVVYRGWYFGWYWLVFRWYHTNQYQRKTRLVDFGITNLAGAYYRGVRLATTIHDTIHCIIISEPADAHEEKKRHSNKIESCGSAARC
jgi:hypothetical protein